MTCSFAKKWPCRVPTYLSTNVQLNYGYCFSVVCAIMWPKNTTIVGNVGETRQKMKFL